MMKKKCYFMEMRNVSYVERPHAIMKFERKGFSVSDIVITKADTSHYNMYAVRNS